MTSLRAVRWPNSSLRSAQRKHRRCLQARRPELERFEERLLLTTAADGLSATNPNFVALSTSQWTTVDFQNVTVDAAKTGVYNLAFSALAGMSSYGYDYLRVMVDGNPYDPSDVVATSNNNYSSFKSQDVSFSRQLTLAAGAHVVSVQAESTNSSNNLGYDKLQLTGYNAIGTQTAADAPPPATTANTPLPYNSWTNVDSLSFNVDSSKTGLYDLAFSATAAMYGSGADLFRVMVDGNPYDPNDIAQTSNYDYYNYQNDQQVSFSRQLTLAMGPHTVTVQAWSNGSSNSVSDARLQLTGYNWVGSQTAADAPPPVTTAIVNPGSSWTMVDSLNVTVDSSKTDLYNLAFGATAGLYGGSTESFRVVVDGNAYDQNDIYQVSNTTDGYYTPYYNGYYYYYQYNDFNDQAVDLERPLYLAQGTHQVQIQAWSNNGSDNLSDAKLQLTGFNYVRVAPSLSVTDAGGTYNGSAFSATATVAGVIPGVDTTPGPTLEGVAPTLAYYAGTYTSVAQTTGLTPLSGAPSAAGSYTVVASFAGSTDYSSATALADFSIAQAAPTLSVADAGGTYNGSAYAATGSVTGVTINGSPEALGTPAFTYYANTGTSASPVWTPIAGPPSDAGSYEMIASYAGSTNYTTGSRTIAFAIKPALLSATASEASMYYGQPVPTLTGTLTGVVNDDGITASFSTAATASSPAGTDPITATLNDPNNRLANYSVTSTPGTLTIDAAPTTVSLPLFAAGIIYGRITGPFAAYVNVDSAMAPGDTAVPTGSVQFYLNGQAFGTPAALVNGLAQSEDLGVWAAGNYTFMAVYSNSTASGAPGDGDFTGSTSNSESATVHKATPAIAWSDPAGIAYGTPLSYTQLDATASIPPPYLGAPSSPVDGTFSYSPAAGTVLSAGSGQTLSTTFTPADTADYNSISASVTINVSMADQTIAFGAPADKTYGDAPFALGATASSGLPVTYTILSGPATVSGDLVTITGTGPVMVEASQAGDGNNNPAMPVDESFNVARAHLTVVADDQAKTYDGSAFTGFTAHYTGFVYGETSSVVRGTASFSGAAVGAIGAGGYAITPGAGSLAAANYDFTTFTAGTLTIGQRAVTVTADARSKTYGDADPALTYQITGGSLVGGDGFTGAPTRVAGEDVGSYAIRQGTLTAGGNYTLTYVGANLQITARPITVTANSGQNKVYGASDPTLTDTVTSGNLVGNDALSGVLGRDPGESVGSYAIHQGTLTAGTNYNLTFVGANFAITPRDASVTPDATSKIYGDADPAFSGTLSGFLAADGVTATYSRTAGETVLGGPYSISATLSPSSVLTNYSITYNTASFAITKANASISIAGYHVTYDGNAHTATGTATGVKGESLAGLSLTGTTLTGATAGAVSDSWTFTDTTGNYNNATGTVNDQIDKANATISVTAYGVTYDGNAHTANGTATGVKGEALSGLSLSGTMHTNAGTYNGDPWTFTDSTGNYNNASGTVNDSIAKLPMVITITSPVAPTPVGTAISVGASFTNTGVVGTRSATWSWGDGTSNTSGTVTGPSSGNYSVSGSHTYNAAGVYTITLTVTDGDGSTSSATSTNYIVIYDPSAGFVTGGGWINSPAGADVANPSLAGKANFGFDAKYLKGATVPTGNTQFQFQVGNFNFHSTSYQWLVVSGALAQYKGAGTVNGVSGYGFLLTAEDGQISGGGGVDGFRIKVTDSSGNVVYDNMMNNSDQMTGSNTEPISGGSIIIHQNQRVAGGAVAGGPDAGTLTVAEAQPLLSEAIAYWARAGATPSELAAMRSASVRVADLPDDLVGVEGGDLIWLDVNAAGHGWFLDATSDPRAFAAVGGGVLLATPGSPASGRVDLLTVVEHELGHVIGLADDAGSDLMGELLPVGVRRLPGPADLPTTPPSPAGPIVIAPIAPPAGPAKPPTASTMVGAPAAPVVAASSAIGVVSISTTGVPGPQPTGHRRPGRSLTGSVNPGPVGSKHSVLISTGSQAKGEHDRASARAHDRLASESTVRELALNLLQGRGR